MWLQCQRNGNIKIMTRIQNYDNYQVYDLIIS